MAKLRKFFGKEKGNRNLDPTLNQNINTVQPQYQTGQEIIDNLNFITAQIAETQLGLTTLMDVLGTDNNEAIYTLQSSLNALNEKQEALLKQPFLKG